MENEIDTLVIGAGYFSIGYALAHPECVVMESSQMLGGEFHHSLVPAEISDLGAGETGTELAELFRQEHVWEKGSFDLLKATLVLHRYVSEHPENFHILMDARVLTVQKEETGYQVTYVDQEGIHHLHCKKMLDTTACRETAPSGVICNTKFLNLFLVSVTDSFEQKLTAVCPDCIIVPGEKKGERFVKFPSQQEETKPIAYRRVAELWRKAFPKAEEQIMFVAEEFESICEETRDCQAPCPWIGKKFTNPLTAFAQGMTDQMV